MFIGLELTDMETCYKVFRREIIQGIKKKIGRRDASWAVSCIVKYKVFR